MSKLRSDPFGRKTQLCGSDAEELRQGRPAGVQKQSGIRVSKDLTPTQILCLKRLVPQFKEGRLILLTGQDGLKDQVAQFLYHQGIPFSDI